MELGIFTFGSRARDPHTGSPVSTAASMRNIVEAIELADEVGLDVAGIGEHHTADMPASAGDVVLAAAAARTERIRLISAVTVLTTDDPVRVFQRFATLDAVSGGRAEITAGRGSSTESFPLFGEDLDDMERLFEEKLELLLRIDREQPVSWSGTVRPSLDGAEVWPRPDAGRLPIWRATGGTEASSIRAGEQGLPIAYAILSGTPHRYAKLADRYRAAARSSGTPPERIRVAVASPGFLGDNAAQTREQWWHEYHDTMRVLARRRGRRPPTRAAYREDTALMGALFVGDPEQIASRIVSLQRSMGHDRHLFQMDLGTLPQADLLHSIELLGTRVKPMVDERLAELDGAAPTAG